MIQYGKFNLSNIKFNLSDIYVGIWILYYLQNILYPAGIINRILVAAFLIISVYRGGKYMIFLKASPLIIKATAVLLWCFIIYGSVFILFPDVELSGYTSSYVYLQNSLMSLLPILVFYDFFRKGYLDEKRMLLYIIPFMTLCIIQYYSNYTRLLELSQENNEATKEFTNVIGYQFVALIPMLCLIKNQLLKYGSILLCLFFIFSSVKRGAILTGLVIVIFIFFLNIIYYKKGQDHKISGILYSSILIIGSIFFVAILYNESDYFVERIEQTQQGDSSERDLLYSKIWHSYLNGDITQVLFGRGAYSTIECAGNYAHNDWLETIYDTGLLGFILLFLFYFSMLKSLWLISKDINFNQKMCFGVLFINCFLPTIFSMSIQEMALYQTLPAGYLSYLVYIRNGHKKNLYLS